MKKTKITPPASKKYADQKGITLISLVVTIIILLILAGVTLALISGSDGILGRASHALDENKIAMAKEQVELALSDFQAEFFDEKYVERTNNGTKKDYISEKLQAGVETTNFYVKASSEGNVVVYEGKDSSGTEVIKGSIEEDASIKWDSDGSIGSSGGNDNSEGNDGSTEGGNNSSGGNVNSEEIAKMKDAIAKLQEDVKEISKLKEEIEVLGNQLKMTNDTLDSILTSQTRKDVLYESNSAIQAGKLYNFTFPSGKTLSNYKMLVFYSEAYYLRVNPNSWMTRQITMAETEIKDEKYTNSVTFSHQGTSENYWNFHFSIPNSNQFRVDTVWFGKDYTGVRIYKVIGIY